MSKFENLEYADELLKIQYKYVEGDTEPLNQDEIDDLVEILRKELEIINGERDDILENEEVLTRLKEMQENHLQYEKDDLLYLVSRISNRKTREKIIKEIFDMEVGTEDCFDMLKDFLK